MTERVWIDLGYPPHVFVFEPIVKELKRQDHKVTVTAREAFETCGLLDLKGMEYYRIGKHGGKKKALKVLRTIGRASHLLAFAMGRNFSVAVSHGSPSQQVVTKVLQIPCIFMTDYEHTIPHLSFFTKILVPKVIPDDVLRQKKVKLESLVKYDGLKENLYVKDFTPDPALLDDLGVDNQRVIVTVRPPATQAHYHNPESETLLFETLDSLAKQPNVHIVLLARKEQRRIRAQCMARYEKRLILPEKTVDGLNLIWHSDLLISGGGSMNREAAVLGVPAYSIFRGKIGAVDRCLEREGKLRFIRSSQDIDKIRIEKRDPVWPIPTNKDLVPFIVDQILSVAK